LWIHFSFLCDVSTQIRLHKIFRSKIFEWRGLYIDGSVLTYHFSIPRNPNDSLYVCLNIPSINLPTGRNIQLLELQENQLPEEIRATMTLLAKEYFVDSRLDKLEKRDYQYDLIVGNASSIYNASVDTILNFASKGTEIALDLLYDERTKQKTWKNDKEIAIAVERLVNERLVTQNERHWGLHFTCNSMFLAIIVEKYLRGILNQHFNGESKWALGFLYEIERSGNIQEAGKKFLPIVQLDGSFFQ
jgi:hypothetical protein